MRRRRGRIAPLAIGGAAGLAALCSLGGAVLAWAEGTSYLVGVRLAFSTVSTTGFGMGPQTAGGTFTMFAVFVFGACCWCTILVAYFQAGVKRYYDSVDGLRPLAGQPWPSSFVPKGHG